MLNKVILMGRFTRDPELRSTPQGISTCAFSIAVDRNFVRQGEERKADFINCVAWRQTAEFISKYFKKGSMVALEGSIQTRSWDDQDGKKRYATDVVVDEVNFVDSKSENPASSQGGYSAVSSQPYIPESYSAPAYASPASSETPKLEVITDDDELPF